MHGTLAIPVNSWNLTGAPCARHQPLLWHRYRHVLQRPCPPHFHAIYGSMEAVIQIESGLAEGMLPKRILAMTQQWRILHREELLVAWKLAQKQERLPIIPPLE